MDKGNCEIVRDLMPLVIDQVASPAATEMVEKHIAECAECREVMAQMRTELATKVPETDTSFIRFCKRLEKGFRWRRVLLGTLAALLVGAILWLGICQVYWKMYIFSTDYLPKLEDCKVEFRAEDDGFLRVTMPYPDGYTFRGWRSELSEDGTELYIYPQRSEWKAIFSRQEDDVLSELVDGVRLVDGVLYRHEVEPDFRYDSESGYNITYFSVKDTPIRGLYLGTEKIDLDALAG